MLKILAAIFLWPITMSAQSQGKMRIVRYMLNPDRITDTLKVTTTIWYFGNRSIQEVPIIEIRSDSSGDKVKTRINYFLYVDPAIPQYSYYKSFSDTSKIVSRSTNKKIVSEKGGWDGYSNEKFAYEDKQKLLDTTISGQQYGRYCFSRKVNGKTSKYILYSSCNNKEVPIKYLNGFAQEISCPIVRMDIYFDNHLTGMTEVEYLSDYLNDQEKIVFEKWNQDANKKFKR